MKDSVGMDVYGMSLQNELWFSQPFSSCVYTHAEYADLLATAGPKFSSQLPNTKLFGPECMGDYDRYDGVKNYFGAITGNTGAKNAIGALAVHSYLDGVAADYGSADGWTKMYNDAKAAGVPLWMTETSGYGNDWSSAFKLAKSIFIFLKHGKGSAWVWWALCGPQEGSKYCLFNTTDPSDKAYASKHYYRFIRPGAKMVACNSSDNQILSAAFEHKENACVSIVLINQSSGSKTVSIKGSGLPSSYTMFTTTSSMKCKEQGDKQPGSITLPGTSITTLVSGKYIDESTSTKETAPAPARLMPRPVVGTRRLFTLDGRSMGSVDRRRKTAAHGTYYSVGYDKSGRRVLERRVLRVE